MKIVLDTRSCLTGNLWEWDRQDSLFADSRTARLRVMNSESSLNSCYRGRTVEFFIRISDSDKARISHKRCTTRTWYILHSRVRTRLRFCEPLVNLRSLFIEIYSAKHSARRRCHRSRYGPLEYQSGIFASLSPLPIFVSVEAISYAFCKAILRQPMKYATPTEFLRYYFSSDWAFLWLITVNRVKYLWFIGIILQSSRKMLQD